jgi:alkylation response protein AidB-like acyl-CoA dehydrogenase
MEMSSVMAKEKDYLALGRELAREFALTAAERDANGGTAKAERDRIRKSGLLLLRVPKEYGGPNVDWKTVLQIVRELAVADGSLAHVLGYHYLQQVTPHFFGTLEQREKYYRGSLRHNWFWANAINPRDRRVILTPEGKGYRLHGKKSFCSGSKDSDMLVVSAIEPDTNQFVIAVVPSMREGVVIRDDWDCIGQRQTDSGTVEFHQVRVEGEEVLSNPGPGSTPFATLRTVLSQLIQAQILVGIAEGALEESRKFVETRPRVWSGVNNRDDPHILYRFGKMWTHLQAAKHLVDHASEQWQEVWEKQEQLTSEERIECAIQVAVAKTFAADMGLQVTSRIFDVMGASSTNGSLRFDRFWRNLRTLSLHDPLDHKTRQVGDWFLNRKYPHSEFYT